MSRVDQTGTRVDQTAETKVRQAYTKTLSGKGARGQLWYNVKNRVDHCDEGNGSTDSTVDP